MSDKPTPTFSEAPASWNVRYHQNGYDCQLTLRAETGAELLKKTGAALEWLQANGATPTTGKPATTPATNGNGAPAAVPQSDPGWCKLHGVAMQQHTKDGRSWYSHRLEDGSGYCKGK